MLPTFFFTLKTNWLNLPDFSKFNFNPIFNLIDITPQFSFLLSVSFLEHYSQLNIRHTCNKQHMKKKLSIVIGPLEPLITPERLDYKCYYAAINFIRHPNLTLKFLFTGERPYKCDAENCGKSFTRNEELTRHKRIHSGLRPYPCTHCGKKFGRKDHLKKHLRTHFPQPRYVSCYPYMYGGYTSVIL